MEWNGKKNWGSVLGAKIKPKEPSHDPSFTRLAPAAEGPWHCCGLLDHFPFGDPGKVRGGAWELRRISGGYRRPREREEGRAEALPAMTHPCLAPDLSTRAIKAGGLLMTFTLRSRASKHTPTVQFPESQCKTTSRLNSSFTHRLPWHRAGILLAQPTSDICPLMVGIKAEAAVSKTPFIGVKLHIWTPEVFIIIIVFIIHLSP